MTEAEWLASDDPVAMLHALQVWYGSGGTPTEHEALSDRKLRLFACAAARLIKPNTKDAESIESCEAWADGGPWPPTFGTADGSVMSYANPDAAWGASQVADPAWGIAYYQGGPAPQAQKVALLREVVGNPFRPVTLPNNRDCPACRGEGRFVVGSGEDAETMACRCCPWITPTVLTLAQAAYDERPPRRPPAPADAWSPADPPGTGRTDGGTLDPFRLALLSDALEEAGCPAEVTEAGEATARPAYSAVLGWRPGVFGGGPVTTPHPLLAHLRSPGPHVRGCWALDLVLGRG